MKRTFHLGSIAAVSLMAVAQGGCMAAEDEMRPEVAFAPATASCGATPPAGRICGCVYDLPLGTRRLPDFAPFRPVEMICTDRLDVSLRSGPPGFPGVTGRFEWFGVDFQGTFVVAQPGAFSFRLASDDGAKLYVDDVLVLNNDGLHDVRVVEGMVPLDAGPHRIRVPYWDGPGPMALTLEVARPGEPYEVLRVDRAL
jgi:PA14 domain-containing protein